MDILDLTTVDETIEVANLVIFCYAGYTEERTIIKKAGNYKPAQHPFSFEETRGRKQEGFGMKWPEIFKLLLSKPAQVRNLLKDALNP